MYVYVCVCNAKLKDLAFIYACDAGADHPDEVCHQEPYWAAADRLSNPTDGLNCLRRLASKVLERYVIFDQRRTNYGLQLICN